MSAKIPQLVRRYTLHPMHKRRRSSFLPQLLWGAVLVAGGCTGSVSQKASPDDSGGTGGSNAEPKLSDCNTPRSVGGGQWRRLTSAQYVSTVRDLLGETADTSDFVLDNRTGPFKTNVRVIQEDEVNAYDAMSKTLSEKAVSNMSKLLNCDTKAVGEDQCASEFIKTFGARAYRRPLVADEEESFRKVYNTGKEESFSAGIRLVVQAMLESPSFLYLVETGSPYDGGLRKLSGYEVASRLSYALAGTMPDADLFTAAREGRLDTAAGIREHAQRLVQSDKFNGRAAEFHVELLGVDWVTSSSVSKPDAAEFDGPMRAAMLEESHKYVEYVMSKGEGTIEEIFTNPYVFPGNGPLTKIYGSSAKPVGDGRSEITDGTRKGILALAGVQASHPRAFSPRMAVNRGNTVRSDVLCDHVPSPEMEIDFTLPPGAEKLSAQELLRRHQENASCKSCHELMDSIGFGFESYDAIGKHRTKDGAGNPIITSGEIVNADGGGKFANANEMADLLAKSPQVRSCMSRQWLRFAVGRDPDGQADACSLEGITKSFSNGKGNIKEGVLSLVSSDAFRFIRGE